MSSCRLSRLSVSVFSCDLMGIWKGAQETGSRGLSVAMSSMSPLSCLSPISLISLSEKLGLWVLHSQALAFATLSARGC